MSINKIGSNRLYVWISAAILVILLAGDIGFKHTLETCKRAQAVYNLEQAELCTASSIKGGTDVLWALRRCTKNSRTGPTGDMYVLDYKNLEFVYDVSKDVPKQKHTYFTEESIGTSFVDWSSAATALTHITSGKNSEPSTRVSYNYDGEWEWLEWRNFYTNQEQTEDGNVYILVQGIQSDEAIARFNVLRWFFGISGFGVAFVLIVLSKQRG